MSDEQVVDVELVEEEQQDASLAVAHPAALEAMERAQQDSMVATAHQWPRPELKAIRDRMLGDATIDEETAESCFYTLKRKSKDGKVALIQGPSIRLAEIALVRYRNIRAASRVIANDGRKITSQGVCYDAENNVLVQVEESRSILYRGGQTFSEDMQIVTGRANNSVAKRNAIFSVIPRVLINPVYEAAKKVAVGDQKTLDTKRQSVLGRFAQMGVTHAQVLRVIEKESVESIDLEALELLIGLGNAIKDGMASIADVFGEREGEDEDDGSKRRMTLRDIARAANEKKAEERKKAKK